MLIRPLSYALLAILASPVGLSLQAEDTVEFQRDVAPLLNKFCVGCHGPRKVKGELRLDTFTSEQSLKQNKGVWEGVLDMLESELMPPEDSPQPSAEQRRRLTASIEAVLYHVDCKLERDPGRVTVRRLNRAEYNNTVRDLLGVDLRPADDFPSDDVGEGFDNIGDVLSMPPLLLEKYLAAAEQLTAAVIVLPESRQPKVIRREGDQLKASGGGRADQYGVFQFYSSGGVQTKISLAAKAKYKFRLRAEGDQAGDEPAKAEVLVDNRRVSVIDVPAKRGDPQTYEISLELDKGQRSISVQFINDYYRPNEADRNLYIHWLELIPSQTPIAQQDLPPTHRRLLPLTPGKQASVRQAAQLDLLPTVQRAFRRQVSPAEVAPYVKLVELAVSQGDSFERGMQVALTAVLVSPQFLFRIERDPDPNDPTKKHDLSQYELATRLSYFLWSSMPDDRLFALASQGQLSDEKVLEQETRRLLRDARSYALVENFGGQWLNLRNLDEAAPDPNIFRFSKQLREDMKGETYRFFNAVMREDRSILDFLQADFTFVNQRLAEHYRLPGVRGDHFRRVSLDPKRYAGVLTQGSVLTLTSNPARTSPVRRGKWILENILGTPPPDPPPNVPELEATSQSRPNASLREQLEIHRQNENCAVCHRQMDAMGFGLENFDAVGRWRDLEKGRPIDSRGELPGGRNFSGAAELARVLADNHQQISRCLSEKMLTYALGRGLQYFDRCAVDGMIERLEREEHRFSALVVGIVLSEPFRQRRGEAPHP